MTKSLLSIVRLDSRSGRRAVARLSARSGEVLDARLVQQVRRLVDGVRRKGDPALLRAVRRFDLAAGSAPGVEPGSEPCFAPASVAELRFAVPDPAAAAEHLPAGFADALELAIAAVERFHRRQVHPGFTVERDGVTASERRQPFRRVAAYVPGGRASYPSTAVMTVVPARVAGVEEVVVVTPPASWLGSPALRYTLARLGVDEVWGMGGAHAVAALAYGTASVARVDKIVGPGNAWVTAAKRLVAGDVAIDGLAGPTEVVIVADGSADPGLVAADLLAQAEHDPRAAALLVTPDAAARQGGAQGAGRAGRRPRHRRHRPRRPRLLRHRLRGRRHGGGAGAGRGAGAGAPAAGRRRGRRPGRPRARGGGGVRRRRDAGGVR